MSATHPDSGANASSRERQRANHDGRERDTGARISQALESKAARQTTSP